MMATHGNSSLPSSGSQNGEWYVVKLPEQLKDMSVAQILNTWQIPSKIAGQLLSTNSVQKQRDRLSLRLFPQEVPEFVAQWVDLNILYEDEFTLVVNKPAGCEIYPGQQEQQDTLANYVSAYYEASGQACRIRHIHRLDKETTGPVLYAKNKLAHYIFDRDMREKKLERIYVAIAEGIVKDNNGTINRPIGRDRHHATRRRISPTGATAVTHYEVLERFAQHTFLRLRLETGRTHQIRVHLSAIGHPLAGDSLYGGKQQWISRQALHGEQLKWIHPWTKQPMAIHAPLPDDLQAMLSALRNERNS